MPAGDELVVLYFSDFFIKSKRTLNTLCLFYDRVFLHDYFGIFICVEKSASKWAESTDPRFLHLTWAVAGGLTSEHLACFRDAAKDAFDATVLKGVAQGLGCQTGSFSPTFVIDFARDYGRFLKECRPFFGEDVLALCQTLQNPHHPAVIREPGVKLDLAASEKENLRSLQLARQNNARACMFEQTYHSFPLVSDQEEDLLRWDRDSDLLVTALAEATITSVVPTISDVPAEEILSAREKLKDLLPPFRSALKTAAWDVAVAARSASRSEVSQLAQLYFKTRIEPAVKEIERKLREEDTKLRHKLLERGIDSTMLLAKAIDPTDPLSKWDLVGSSLKSLLDIDDSLQSKAKIRSPYEFLVKLPRAFRK